MASPNIEDSPDNSLALFPQNEDDASLGASVSDISPRTCSAPTLAILSSDLEPQGTSPNSLHNLRPPSRSSWECSATQYSSTDGPSRTLSGATTFSNMSNLNASFSVSQCASGSHEAIFSVSVETLEKLLEQRTIADFDALGGLRGLANSLLTDCHSGIAADTDSVTSDGSLPNIASHTERRRVFGENHLLETKSKTFLYLLWLNFNDTVLLLLSAVAVVSLALGLYQTFGQPHKPGQPKVEWVDSVTILTAVLIVVVVGALNDYQKEKQFAKLNRKVCYKPWTTSTKTDSHEQKADRMVKAIRSGRSIEISIHEVMAGDILHVEPGDVLPADGVLVSGHNVCCDESTVTGESNPKRKTPAHLITDLLRPITPDDDPDPFMISGTKVLEGLGTYLATGVGLHSINGKLMMSITNEEPRPTPLQVKLTAVANQIATAGVSVAVFLFLALFIKFLWGVGWSQGLPSDGNLYVHTLLRITIVSITVVVIAVPEGLPLAVTLALAFTVTRMLKDKNLVRVLSACETMGGATSIFCDKTGTLTTNRMTVVGGLLGTKHQFGAKLLSRDTQLVYPHGLSELHAISTNKLISLLSEEVRYTLSQSIVINSTAFESEENGRPTFVGSRTESALLSFARERLGIGPVAVERTNAQITQVIPFDSSRKYMVSVVNLGGVFRMYMKGAPEVLLAKCSRIVKDATSDLDQTAPVNDYYDLLSQAMHHYSDQALRMIGLAYQDFPAYPPPGVGRIDDEPGQTIIDDALQDMIFLGIFCIQDPLRPGVEEAVAKCQYAGVTVRMVTGDNIGTATTIAKKCGILEPHSVVLEGPAFRMLSKTEMYQVIPRLRVLARSSPEDKRVLVMRAKELGETVAVTGDGTNDGPALRMADIGFSMGMSGSEIAREASSIILMEDEFSSIVKAIEWGRAVNDSVKKFLQFQLTVNITAVTLTCVSAIASEREEPILTPVQLLWVNLIMDTFAALALATDPPAPSVLDRKPQPKTAPLVTIEMWKMIIGQSVYQLAVVLALNFAGSKIIQDIGTEDSLKTLVFNTYVWMQFFNQYNNRRLDSNLNVFEGILTNWYFIGINVITIIGQISIISFGGNTLSAVRLSPIQWVISLVLGALSLMAGVIVRLIPNELLRSISAKLGSICLSEEEDDRF
ncbi:hypothetical protein EYZ11_010031 [Aspergillus tanneri]|uniref:Calcium-transporting ATPase n=1 Tax=Aspergillus tanneri TaxID=1220188 RepID=A0A4S3J6M8_9EURO|nr:hypothetical protein EYZ11_010031 [Aspergillus tanneri]